MEQQLLKLIEDIDAQGMISFLKALTPDQRKALVPAIKEYDDSINNSYEKRNEPRIWEKERINKIAMFVCFSPKEFKSAWRWAPDAEILDQILPWYCPKNFEEYNIRSSYQYLVKWEQAGYIKNARTRILNTFPRAIFRNNQETRECEYTLDIIEEYPISLDQHIWWMFEEPSGIEWSRNNCKNMPAKYGYWEDTFIKYTTEGRLDRMRVLRESLTTVTRNFNKTQTGWFVNLFVVMQPTNDELIELQDELFATLTSVWSKPVSTTMKLFKKLAADPRFRTEEFLPSLPLLLNSEVKTIVTATLAVVEVLLKQKSTFKEEIFSVLGTAFLNKDEAIQQKTATLFIKYLSPGVEAQNLLLPYADSLLSNTRTTLKEFLPEETQVESVPEDIVVERQPLINECNRIPVPTSVEDFVFALSQALEMPEPYYLDHLLNSIAVWGNEVTEQQLVLLEPVFQKVYKALAKWEIPQFDGMVHLTLTDYAAYLIKKFPNQTNTLIKYRDKLTAYDKDKHYVKRQKPLSELQVKSYYTGFQQIALGVIQKLKVQDKLPLLSAPTHLPIWIDPFVLVQKLIAYQQQGTSPIDMDMQLAIQRCALDNTQDALALANEQLTGELKDLMLFLFNRMEAWPQQPDAIAHPAWWVTAAIVRSPGVDFPELKNLEYKDIPAAHLSGNHGWETYIEEYLGYGQYSTETRSWTRVPKFWNKVRLTTPKYELKKHTNPLFIEYVLDSSPSDEFIEYMLMTIPNNLDLIVGYVGTYLNFCGWEVAEQRVGISTGKALQILDVPFREMHYLALSALFMGDHKPARDYALSIWTDRVMSGTIDSARVGKAIGIVESIEMNPLKRLTDLISLNMMGISAQHNRALLELVEALLAELSEKPIKNLKKLLEIYVELLVLNQAKANMESIPQLKAWAEEGNLKKVVKRIVG
ncbi:DUF6493 family protein [Bacteroides sp. 519]|uniref:DUF6493 family protein n=1 Tax=Bacteroides sp. 519 TaxID=2302937 RepID=UPI0013D72A12|nr:DUF6493 family protein [Bacteroides sp. 519]NDV60486.1 hypothetical protein [Bacteroides sp. 519]